MTPLEFITNQLQPDIYSIIHLENMLLRELKKSFQLYIVDFIRFANGKIKKYMTVGKRISSSFKHAQPEVASFIRLGDTLSQCLKTENAILQLMKKK